MNNNPVNEFLDGFIEVTKSSTKGTDVCVVAGNLLRMRKRAMNHLNVTDSDRGKKSKTKISVRVNQAQRKLLIMKSEKGLNITGTKKGEVDLYGKPVCDLILGLIGKELTNAGTINFEDIQYDETDNGTPYIMISLDSYSASDSALQDKEVKVND